MFYNTRKRRFNMSISIYSSPEKTFSHKDPARSAMFPKQTLRARRNWTLGIASYTREDLLEALHADVYLDIRVVGVCYFASDVSADLADAVVRSFKLAGRLIASPAVFEVLQQKRV